MVQEALKALTCCLLWYLKPDDSDTDLEAPVVVTETAESLGRLLEEFADNHNKVICTDVSRSVR